MTAFNRRDFIKSSALFTAPAFLPLGLSASPIIKKEDNQVAFIGDGKMYSPTESLELLLEIDAKKAIETDVYGKGGVVEELEKEFAKITGKEKAIYVPSGTMANQLAISVLSGNKSKVFLQDSSHVYRDEADAANLVFNKRLMPLGQGEAYFTSLELRKAIESLPENEVFDAGVGAVSIENPVRRNNGALYPVEEIRKISTYCKANNIKLHLDGARLHLASARTDISIKEYSFYFDTVYISLYKYLGAAGGAILCGDADVIDKVPALIKIHGGSMYKNWQNAAMALYKLKGIEERMKKVVIQTYSIVDKLNQLGSIHVDAIPNGTNIYRYHLEESIDAEQFVKKLEKNHNIIVRPPSPITHQGMLMMNETLLNRTVEEIVEAFSKSLSS